MSRYQSSVCPDCAIEPFRRNHYFTGKLLVERDFTDEQRYYVDKLRLHHQQLHGHGVVCGLKVKQHDNPACRDRMICIEPGTAIDCCGHDILVWEPECVDFTQLESFKAAIEPEDTRPHVLQICLRYQECPTEDIPVLFDECGCDDTQCAPNRILESYGFDVIVDPEPEAAPLHSPSLAWHCTASPAHASRVALHASGRRLYVITADNKKTIFQVDTDNLTIVGAHALPAKGLELAVSNDGQRVYVVTEANSGASADPRQLVVLDTANNMGNPPISISNLANSGDSEIFLAVVPAPDNRLLALVGKTGAVLIYPTTLDTSSPAPAPITVNLGPKLRGLAVASDGKHAYTTDAANNTLPVLDLSATPGAGAAITVLPAGAQPSQLTLVASTAPDMLAVISQASKQLHLVALNPPALAGSVSLAHSPIAVAVAPGGQWAYVLEQGGADSYIQAVNLHRIQSGLPPLVSAPFKVGRNSQQVVIAEDGARLYIPFDDDPALDNGGGVAVIEVREEDCADILWRDLDSCPTCDTGDCVVLATIENYHVGDRVDDARIDNRAGRHLLPSVQTLAELIECLLTEGPGAAGPQGPPGQPGLGIDDVQATFPDCVNGVPAAGSASIQPIGGQRVLVLQIPKGCDGKPGKDGKDGKDGIGLYPDLPKILDIEWTHRATVTAQEFVTRLRYDSSPNELIERWQSGGPAPLLTIYFNQRMRDIDRQTFRVSFEFPQMLARSQFTGLYNPLKLDLYGHVMGVPNPPPPDPLSRTTPHTAEMYPWAATFIPYSEFFSDQLGVLRQAWDGQSYTPPLDLPTIQVLLKGDFIWAPLAGTGAFDEKRVLDADNIGGQVGINRVRGGIITGGKNPSGDLAQGGNFESWFFLAPLTDPVTPINPSRARDVIFRVVAGVPIPAVEINTASRPELMAVRGIGVGIAERILRERDIQPFADLDDFRARVRPNASSWNLMRDDISVIAPEE